MNSQTAQLLIAQRNSEHSYCRGHLHCVLFFHSPMVMCDYVAEGLAKPHGLLVGMSVCVSVCMYTESQLGVCHASGLALVWPAVCLDYITREVPCSSDTVWRKTCILCVKSVLLAEFDFNSFGHNFYHCDICGLVTIITLTGHKHPLRASVLQCSWQFHRASFVCLSKINQFYDVTMISVGLRHKPTWFGLGKSRGLC